MQNDGREKTETKHFVRIAWKEKPDQGSSKEKRGNNGHVRSPGGEVLY